ncbi:MAG: hypothetical protein A2W72_10400 [Burkholderiales bacterium RIFCSPLOWO2_12_67_14]|nr:MAG: hypothetical protein A3I64_16380 [Burkholderiales bacterium RIFCSPLOWO2_02_FULL_67_64]OGB35772.1 MAG: hypothetical protein A3E51_06020 [Burkholderiales bacterium RIFCSPHIGHO2_12_FULL_67_38]OGB43401.1 MAG: hypothetical protein A2W72_10400 [Burkholderiales bacterium RIFCSPLOWO2_12_67_14]OGB98390.1 MAG: hypothetical protein A3G82_12115 [Burkholderiales bacterium RIFCSPLOWO2_12_FULL_67_210]
MRPKAGLRARDALDQLRLDYEVIRKLLREYDSLRLVEGCAPARKAEIVDRLCDALSLNAQIEEEIFYPVVRPVLGCNVRAQAALWDHTPLRHLIARLDEMDPADPAYDGTVIDLGDCVLARIEEARAVLFVEVRVVGLDTAALGEQMARWRRAQQQQDLTLVGLPQAPAVPAPGWPLDCRLTLA